MAQKQRILLIENEEDVAALLKLQADLSGYRLNVEIDGINGLLAVQREKPDLVVIDVMLPGQSGLDVCRKIKSVSETKHIPVIMLSNQNDELNVILGFELGADDYISKPFSPKILFSRVKAILKRNKEIKKTPKMLNFGAFTLEPDRYLLLKNNLPISLTLSEFGILKKLVTNKGKVLTRNQLLEEVHNEDAFIVDRNIDVHIASLRKKLGMENKWIETVRGIGYRFKDAKSL